MSARRVAWALVAVTLVLVAMDILVTAAYRPLYAEDAVAVHGFPFVDLAVAGAAVMGAVIVSRYERHPIGWLLCLIGCTGALSMLTEAYSVWVTDEGGPGPRSLGGVSGWVSSLVGGQLSVAGLAIMFLVAPDGHLLSPRWRWAAWLAAAGTASCTVALLTLSPTTYEYEEPDVDPVAQVMFSAGFLLISVGLILSVISMLRRLRRSEGVQRQQLRLIALSAALVAVGLANQFVVQLLRGGEQTWAASLPLFIAYAFVPVLFAIAVLRYRLYDLELIINRALVVALGTAFAAIGYTGLVIAVGALVNTQTSGFWISLLVTALVAIGFQPLRRRVVQLANRLAYGSRAAPYEALADFGRQLAETPSPQALLPAVAEAAGRAVSARTATAVLNVPGAGVVSEVWRRGVSDGAADLVVPVRNGGELLGRVEVSLPRGHPLQAADERLLTDLAGQTALAFRNAAMEAQLIERVEELDRATEELAESRRRLIDADDAARRDLESAIERGVMPHLSPMPDRLHRLRSVGAAHAAHRTPGLDEADRRELEALVTETNEALEALRELTRGVFPTQLTRSGLGPALRSHLARAGVGATLDIDPATAERRFPARVEAAAYFACTKALTAPARASHVSIASGDDELSLEIWQALDSADRLDVHESPALQAISDRVEAVGGALSTNTAASSGPTDGVATALGRALTVRLPLAAAEHSTVPAQPDLSGSHLPG